MREMEGSNVQKRISERERSEVNQENSGNEVDMSKSTTHKSEAKMAR